MLEQVNPQEDENTTLKKALLKANMTIRNQRIIIELLKAKLGEKAKGKIIQFYPDDNIENLLNQINE